MGLKEKTGGSKAEEGRKAMGTGDHYIKTGAIVGRCDGSKTGGRCPAKIIVADRQK